MKQKTIKIYENMPIEDRKNWLTIEQVTTLRDYVLINEEDRRSLISNKAVKKKLFAMQTEDYACHIKNDTGEYYGTKYEVVELYHRASVQPLIDELESHGQKRWNKASPDKKLNDLRSYLANKRNVELPLEEHIVEFYGDERQSLRYRDRGNQYRSYYALFLHHTYITDTVCTMHGIGTSTLDLLCFLYTYKFFTRLDFFHFSGIRDRIGMTKEERENHSRGVTSRLKNLYDLGFVEKVYDNKKSMKKMRIRTSNKTLLRTTEKCDKIVRDYFDYLMYKRKMPYLGSSRNGLQRLTYGDIRVDYLKDKVVNGRHRSTAYIFYEYCYDYINYKADVELFDGEMEEYLRRSESAEFYFNPSVYKIAEYKFLATSGKEDNHKFIKNLMSHERWGKRS